ncbi:membrane dipeptidase [Sphingomonas sp. UYAg733]
MSRREIIATGSGIAFALSAGPLASASPLSSAVSAKERRLVERAMVIDMLAPLKLNFTPDAYAHTLSPSELADFRSSGISAFHNSIGVGGPSAREDALAFIAAWQGFAGRQPDVFALVDRASDLDRAKASGRIAVITGLQNAEQFTDADDVAFFYKLGLRCAQLTYNAQNLLGAGGTERVDGGLTDYGAEIVGAMNKTGMLVDVSHCGDRTTLDAIAASTQPIAITHSNCRALNNHPRLKTDDAIIALAKKGGVMGITGVRNFVRDREPTTVEHVVDHIDHVVKLVGIDHVGIGSDADLNGYDDMPSDQLAALRASYKASYAFREKLDTDGYDRPDKVFQLTATLLRRGYSESNIVAVLGGNFRRLVGSVWK